MPTHMGSLRKISALVAVERLNQLLTQPVDNLLSFSIMSALKIMPTHIKIDWYGPESSSGPIEKWTIGRGLDMAAGSHM